MPGWGESWGGNWSNVDGQSGTGLVEGVFAIGSVNELTAVKVVILPGLAGSAPQKVAQAVAQPQVRTVQRADPQKPVHISKPKPPKPVPEPLRINGTAVVRGLDCLGYVNDLEAHGESISLVSGVSGAGTIGQVATQVKAAVMGMDRELEEAAEWFVLNVA